MYFHVQMSIQSLCSLKKLKYLSLLLSCNTSLWGFSGGSGKETACQCTKRKRHGFTLRVRKIPWSRKQQPTPIFLPGKFHGERSLVGYSPWGHKESDMTERLSIPHFLILGWPKSSFGFFCKILWKNLSELFDQANVF